MVPGASLVVQWLRLCTFNADSTGSIPGQGTNIPHAMQHGQKKKKKDGLWIRRYKAHLRVEYHTGKGEIK